MSRYKLSELLFYTQKRKCLTFLGGKAAEDSQCWLFPVVPRLVLSYQYRMQNCRCVWPDNTFSTNATLARFAACRWGFLSHVDTVGPGNEQVRLSLEVPLPHPQEYVSWPAPTSPAAGCSFSFQRWTKSSLGREAVVGGTGQWQPPRSFSFPILP